MAPNFLSKFVKSNNTLAPFPSDGASTDSRSRTSSDSGYYMQRGRTISGAIDTSLTGPPNLVLTSENDSPVQPSTPGSLHRKGSPVSSSGRRGTSVSPARSERSRPTPISTPRKAATELVDMPHTTSPESDLPSRGPSLDATFQNLNASSLNTIVGGHDNSLKHKTSSKSLRSLRSLGSSGHDEVTPSLQEGNYTARRGSIPQPMHPIVESPTSETMPNVGGFSSLSNDSEASNNTYSGSTSNITVLSASSTASSLQPRQLDSDSISVASSGGISTNVNKDGKKMPWRRTSVGSGKKRKPTGLASAIAASGLAMANPGFTQPLAAFAPPPPNSPQKSQSPPKRSLSGGPRRPSNADRSVRSRQASATYMNGEEVTIEGDFQSDLGSESEDELDLNDEDIPVTGFAVANVKRNTDFHDMFPSVPEGDYLIEDYGCALQKEILIQGRMYISENHICFHANIFGWITDLIIPVYEIISIEKKMTALFIPNAIQLSTRTAKHTFASFLSRDTTYDVIYNVWRLARPDAESIGSGPASTRVSLDERPALENGAVETVAPQNPEKVMVAKAEKQKVTQCKCGRDKTHLAETAMTAVFPGTPEMIYNLMFTSGFIKDFMRNEQQLRDIQISDWCPDPESGLLSRNFSYIKSLSNSMGPKQTRCELKDETIHNDINDYITMLTTTRTPDVPSGGAFSVKTLTCITWASSSSTKVTVTTQLDWTGRSFIKALINNSAIDGQRTYHIDLEKAMRAYIAEHQTEFIPEGMDAAVVELPPAEEQVKPELVRTASMQPATEEEASKRREHERNQRATQWAFDTIMGAWKVAKQSTSGALELLSDAWDQSSSTTILWFVIVILVLSNAWTLKRSFKSEEIGRRKEMQKVEDQRKTIANVAAALLEEQLTARSLSRGSDPLLPAIPHVHEDWRLEVDSLNKALDIVEERVRHLRRSLEELD